MENVNLNDRVLSEKVRSVKNCSVTKSSDKNRTEKKTLLNDMTFRSLLLQWLEDAKIKIKYATYIKYYGIISDHIIPELGKIKIKKINSNLINAFIEKKMSVRKSNGNSGLSSGSIKLMVYIIQSAFNYASEKGYVKKPLGSLTSPPGERKNIDVISRSEQLILEKFLTCDMEEFKLGVLIALNTGLRIGEICGLRWDDINFQNSTINVRRTVQRIKNINAGENEPKTFLAFGEPKTASSNRIVPISSWLLKYILPFYEKSESEYVVSNKNNDFADPRTMQYRFESYLKQCGLRHVNFHVLRHTFATRCIEAGVDTKTLSEILGHANVSITMNIYVHSSLERKKAQIELLNSIHK